MDKAEDDRELKIFLAALNGMRAEDIAAKLKLPLTYIVRVLQMQLCVGEPYGIGDGIKGQKRSW